MSSLKDLICYNLKQPSTNKRKERMLVTNANYNSNCTVLRSINDFASDEDVANALRENLRASRGRLARRRDQQHSNNAAKDVDFPGCLNTEKSITQTVEKELRRLKALKSFEVLDGDTDTSSSSSCDSGSSRRGSISPPASPADSSYDSRGSSPVAAPNRDLSSTLSTMDTLVDMARRMFRVSKAVITLTDLGREKILAARGMGDLQELKRHLPLNAFAGLCFVEGTENALTVIKDTSQDPRFATMLPVKNARFYAGVPLITPEGERIGVMCILDDHPRPQGLPEGEQQDLRHLAGLAMHALVERRARLQLEQKLQQATRVVSATCNDLLTPLSAIELAMALLSDDQDFQGKLSGDQQESLKIATNCVGVLGNLCRGMRDEHSANCTRQVNAVKGITDPRGATVRQVSNSDFGLTTESFRIMYGTGEAMSDNKDDLSEQSKEALPTTTIIKTSNGTKAMAPIVTSTVVVQDMVKSIHLAMDAIPKTVPISIALHASVPSHIVTADRKILSCALSLLQRCVSIAVSGSIQLSIKPQYCLCGKAMLDFQCQIRPEGSDSNVECGHKCCSTTPGYAFGLEKSETTSCSLLCCHNQKKTSKISRVFSEINLHSVAMQMHDLGGDAGIDGSNKDGPESLRFWFRVPLEEPKSLFEIPATTLSMKHADFDAPTDRRVSDTSNPVKGETAKTGDQTDGEIALFMESQPRKRRALIIEDSVVIRKVIANALAKIGIETEIAVNGMEGLHQLQSSHYEVVLCDFLMPVMDGLDCVQQYRDWEKENRPFFHQYIIGMSAHASDKDVERGIAAGMDSYKPKPLTYKGLQDIVSACEKNQQKLVSDKMAVMNNSKTTNNVDEAVVSTLYDRSHTRMCLIASKDEVSCSLATKVAVAKGWKCLIVHDGEDALQALQKRNWDACFLDEKLALLSGRRCASEFREWEQVHRVNLQMNLFILPAPKNGSNDDSAPIAVPPGANGVLQKPLQQKEFEETLEKAEKDQSLHIIMR